MCYVKQEITKTTIPHQNSWPNISSCNISYLALVKKHFWRGILQFCIFSFDFCTLKLTIGQFELLPVNQKVTINVYI